MLQTQIMYFNHYYTHVIIYSNQVNFLPLPVTTLDHIKLSNFILIFIISSDHNQIQISFTSTRQVGTRPTHVLHVTSYYCFYEVTIYI